MYGASTKAQRLQARESILAAAREHGAIVTAHENADCISILDLSTPDYCTVKVFDGTAVRPSAHYYYHSPEQAREALARFVTQRAERVSAIAEERAKGRYLSHAAQTAAAIRVELARLFPGVKFSVRSDNFSMGDSVDVSWTDGPIQALVEPIIHRYEWGTFDGMTDSSGVRELDPDITCPGARFVQADRKMSDEQRARITAAAIEAYGELPAEQYSVYHSGNFEPRLYEERHPELWPEAYRALYAQQQEAQRAASLAAAEKRQREYEQRQSAQAVAMPEEVPAAIEYAARVFGVLEAYKPQMDSTMLDLFTADAAQAVSHLPGEITRDEAARRGKQYAAALLHLSPNVPGLIELSAFMVADDQQMQAFLSIGNAEFEARQAEQARRDALCAQAVSASPTVDDTAAVTIVTFPPEPEPLRLTDPAPGQLARFLTGLENVEPAPANIVSLADYRSGHGL